MIAVMTHGKNFRALATYLFREKTPAQRESVAWASARNLPTDDPQLAVRFMTATAAQSTSVQRPSYHIALTFAPQDPVDRAIIEGVSDRLLESLGLGEHQALYVAHRDRPHPHVHIMVNRVHPETGRVWNSWYDWRRVRQLLSGEERALGLHHVTTRLTKIDDLARDLETFERVVALGEDYYRAQMETGAARAREQRVGLALQRARTTRTRSDRMLATVYCDPERAYQAYTATAESRGPLEASRLMRQQPEQLGALATLERTRALGLWRTADQTQARAAALAAAIAAQEAFDAARAWAGVAQSTAQRAEQVFERELGGIFQESAAPRRAFERLADERGIEAAAAALRERPEVLGMMRTAHAQDERLMGDQVAQAAVRGIDAVRARRDATEVAHDTRVDVRLTFHRSELERATERERAIRAALDKLPERAELERRLGFTLAHLLPHEMRVLKATLSAPRIALVSQLTGSIRDIGLGRDEERNQPAPRQPA